MSPPALIFAPYSRPTEFAEGLCILSVQTTHFERASRALWAAFTPHRLVRRYSDYGWLNRSLKSALAPDGPLE